MDVEYVIQERGVQYVLMQLFDECTKRSKISERSIGFEIEDLYWDCIAIEPWWISSGRKECYGFEEKYLEKDSDRNMGNIIRLLKLVHKNVVWRKRVSSSF